MYYLISNTYGHIGQGIYRLYLVKKWKKKMMNSRYTILRNDDNCTCSRWPSLSTTTNQNKLIVWIHKFNLVDKIMLTKCDLCKHCHGAIQKRREFVFVH